MRPLLRLSFVSNLRLATRPRLPISRSARNFYTTTPSLTSAASMTNTTSLDMSNRQPQTNHRSLSLSQHEDDPEIRQKYRPFILEDTADWVSTLELTTALNMAEANLQTTNSRLKVLVLYGSLRRRSYSRLVAFEACRILFRLGCDVRVFDPEGLPVKNDTDHGHPKVRELRELSRWSDGHVWVSPEQHGNLVSRALLCLCVGATR